MTGVKDVTLEPAKPKRHTFRAGVRELEAQLARTRVALEEKAAELQRVATEARALESAFDALTAAYNLVKPQPRKRTQKAAK